MTLPSTPLRNSSEPLVFSSGKVKQGDILIEEEENEPPYPLMREESPVMPPSNVRLKVISCSFYGPS